MIPKQLGIVCASRVRISSAPSMLFPNQIDEIEAVIVIGIEERTKINEKEAEIGPDLNTTTLSIPGVGKGLQLFSLKNFDVKNDFKIVGEKSFPKF